MSGEDGRHCHFLQPTEDEPHPRQPLVEVGHNHGGRARETGGELGEGEREGWREGGREGGREKVEEEEWGVSECMTLHLQGSP